MKNTKEIIFETAVELFSERGYQGTSMRDLAAAIGIKGSSLYNHFPGKNAILDMILDYYVEGFKSAVPSKDEMEATAARFSDPVELWVYGIEEFFKEMPPLMETIGQIILNAVKGF